MGVGRDADGTEGTGKEMGAGEVSGERERVDAVVVAKEVEDAEGDRFVMLRARSAID